MTERDSRSEKLIIGEEFFSQGSLEAAKEVFLGLASAQNPCKEALNNLGVIACQEGRFDEAVQYLTESLAIDPLYEDALLNVIELREAIKKAGSSPEITGKIPFGDRTPRLANAKIAIVNLWDNKFTDLYVRHFSQKNKVRKVKPQTERDLKEILGWADIIWSQWCNEPLVYLSKQQTDTALVTHIHSYEILTPQLMENVVWDRIDGAIFVAEHMRNNANRLWSKHLAGVPQTTIHNSIDLTEYPLYKGLPGKNIGYVGYINHKKGIGLLLQCIKAAVERDPEYRLHVAGTFQEIRFEVYMTHLIEQMGLSNNVVMHGWVKDIPGWLGLMQYVVSTSPWEGCPLNIIEAMACGVKPLIHNWQGAKNLFPSSLVFNTVSEFINLLTSPDYDAPEYRRHIENHFNADINVSKIDAYLSSVLEKPRSRRLQRHISYSEKNENATQDKVEQSEDRTIEKNNSSTINFYQPLARTVELSTNRKSFAIDFCRGKRVLHVGCVDAGIMESRIQSNNFLHYHLKQVAAKLIGVDIEDAGLERLTLEGYEVYKLDLEKDREKLKELTDRVDVIVIPEVIEHLNNVGAALDNLKACRFTGDILISTPNAFSFRIFKLLGSCIELVHPNHNHYYSPTTLKTILEKHGLTLERLVMYYWLTDDEVGRELQQVMKNCPYYAEGLIGIVRDSEFRDKGEVQNPGIKRHSVKDPRGLHKKNS